MRLFFGGAEVSSHRKLLLENNVKDVYLSYMGLKRRGDKPWLIADNFPDDVNVMVDSGAFTVNKGVSSDLDHESIRDLATGYEAFVTANAGRIHSFTEFDALALGGTWLAQRREDFYDDSFSDDGISGDFMPVWHGGYGIPELERLCERYGRVGILQTSLGNRDIIPVLNMLAETRGAKLHGLAMTKKVPMQEVRWESVGSTSWTSPMRFGDTFVWTGKQLKRYTKPYKEECRKRHRGLFSSLGFDPQKIAEDDVEEVAKLSLWSWQEFVKDINEHAPLAAPIIPDQEGEKPRLQPVRKRSEYSLLPGITFGDGERQEIQVTGESQRRCDTCFLKRTCPAFEPGADCYYHMPLVIKTRDDIKDVENALISMQTQRVMFGRVVEDQEGGYMDQNLSGEIDRLARMIKMQREGTAEKFSLTMSAQSNDPNKPSIMDELFGKKVSEAQSITGPTIVDELLQQSEIYEAEVVQQDE